jgi:hypothetical protein
MKNPAPVSFHSLSAQQSMVVGGLYQPTTRLTPPPPRMKQAWGGSHTGAIDLATDWLDGNAPSRVPPLDQCGVYEYTP